MKTEIIKTESFTLTKRGNKAVTFNRFTMSDGTLRFSIVEGVMVTPTTEDAMKQNYNALLKDGYTLKEEKAQKASAPKSKATAKPKRAKFIWCNASKEIWSKEFHRRLNAEITNLRGLSYKEYNTEREKLVAKIKADMKIWESENADSVNQMILQQRAEADAIAQ